MSEDLPENVSKPVLAVEHASLERRDDSAYRSKCPCCANGLLLVARPSPAFVLSRLDRCVACGQLVWYTDGSVNGEPFAEPPELPREVS